MKFVDRQDSGRRLAKTLKKFTGEDVVVFALPRGGVPVAHEVAKLLKAPLDLVIPRKIGHPDNPEYAICAVTEAGELVCNESERNLVSPGWLKAEAAKEINEAKRRRIAYLKGKEPAAVKGKTVILVDDGIATGLTMQAAIKDIKGRHPAKLVVAIPVIPKDTSQVLQPQVDELVALDIPSFYLGAVGAHYQDFHQTSDREVKTIMSKY